MMLSNFMQIFTNSSLNLYWSYCGVFACGEMTDYRIILPTYAFYPGSEFNGFLYINSETPIKARKIDLTIHGRAFTRWTEHEGHNASHSYRHNGNNGNVTYGCEVKYMYEYAILWKSLDGSNNFPPGEYKFPFTVRIPYGVPPSHFGEYGNVKYFVRTNIDIPWALDEELIVDFAVLGIVDLNVDQKLSCQAYTGATENKIQSSWCCCKCTTLPMILKVSIPKSGYVCGETISVSVNIDNKTPSKILKIEIMLIKSHTFLGNRNASGSLPNENSHAKNCETEEVDQHFDPPVNEITSIYTITVPPFLQPSYLLCPIIKLYYHVVVKVHTDDLFTSGPKVQIPIVIGTVPIVQEQNAISPIAVSPNQ